MGTPAATENANQIARLIYKSRRTKKNKKLDFFTID